LSITPEYLISASCSISSHYIYLLAHTKNASFFVHNIDQGLIGHLQSYSVWAVSIAVVGHLCSAGDAYAYDESADSNGFCMTEAVTSNFAELALVLWQVCSAIMAVIVMKPEWLPNEARARQLFAAFHACVWTPSLVTTAIPWAQGARSALGQHHFRELAGLMPLAPLLVIRTFQACSGFSCLPLARKDGAGSKQEMSRGSLDRYYTSLLDTELRK
jgi:hypothetical protein